MMEKIIKKTVLIFILYEITASISLGIIRNISSLELANYVSIFSTYGFAILILFEVITFQLLSSSRTLTLKRAGMYLILIVTLFLLINIILYHDISVVYAGKEFLLPLLLYFFITIKTKHTLFPTRLITKYSIIFPVLCLSVSILQVVLDFNIFRKIFYSDLFDNEGRTLSYYSSIIFYWFDLRPQSLFKSHTIFSFFCAFLGTISWNRYFATKEKKYLYSFILYFLCTVVSTSRTGTIFLLSAVACNYYISKKENRQIAVSVGFLVLVAMFFLLSPCLSRFISENPVFVGSVIERFEIAYVEVMDYIISHGLLFSSQFGRFGTFSIKILNVNDYLAFTDNTYLYLFLNFGILPALLILSILLGDVRKRSSIIKSLFFGYAVAAFFSTFFLAADINYVFWLLTGILLHSGKYSGNAKEDIAYNPNY